jgi:hypothetical protein
MRANRCEFFTGALAFCLVVVLGLWVSVAPVWTGEQDKRSAESFTAEQARWHLEKGLKHLKKGNYDDAIASFKEAIRRNPDYASAHYRLGLTYAEQGSRRRAMAEHEWLKDRKPSLANMLFAKIPAMVVAWVCSHDVKDSDKCDYQADGTDDHVEIKAAIDALPRAGGRVVLSSGTFNVEPIAIRSGLSISGHGMGVTVLRLNSGARHNSVIRGRYLRNLEIKDLSIDVNGKNQTDQPPEGTRGINIGNSTDVAIEGVEVFGAGGVGLKVYGGERIKLSRCRAHENMEGIQIGASEHFTKNVLIEGCHASNNRGSGITVVDGGSTGGFENIRVLGNVIRANQRTNMQVRAPHNYARNVVIMGNSIDQALPKDGNGMNWGDGILVKASSLHGLTIVGNTIINSGEHFEGDHVGIRIQNASGEVVVMGNIVQGYGIGINLLDSSGVIVSYNWIKSMTINDIKENAQSNGNILSDNWVGSGNIIKKGATTIVRNNHGYNPQPPSIITIGSSPFTYQNRDGYPEDVIVRGNAVSSVEFSRDGKNWYALGFTNGAVHLEPQDSMRITYKKPPPDLPFWKILAAQSIIKIPH